MSLIRYFTTGLETGGAFARINTVAQIDSRYFPFDISNVINLDAPESFHAGSMKAPGYYYQRFRELEYDDY